MIEWKDVIEASRNWPFYWIDDGALDYSIFGIEDMHYKISNLVSMVVQNLDLMMS